MVLGFTRSIACFLCQAEIKRLKAANRAASCERRLLLMQQEDIARLRKNTKKIREKTAAGQAALGQERKENLTAVGHDSSEPVKVSTGIYTSDLSASHFL